MYTHKDIVEIAYKWVLKNASCGVAFKELSCVATGEIADVIGFGAWDRSVLVEVKTSRSDFLADKKKSFRIESHKGMGSVRYYCCPKGLIGKDELPTGWGLLYVDELGKCRSVHMPMIPHPNFPHLQNYKVEYIHERNKDGELGLMYSALRRLHLRGRIDEIYIDPKGVVATENKSQK